MARKFNNGDKLGVVRDILNGNADDINNKVDLVPGKGLSTNDYTNDDKAKLQALGTGGEAPDLSAYQPKQDGFSLVSDTLINKLEQLRQTENDYTTIEKNKLAGIAPSATVNSTDSALRARSSHTGSQAISTITNLQTELNNRPPTTSGSPVKPTGIWYGTQAQYDALPTKTATFKYEIYEA